MKKLIAALVILAGLGAGGYFIYAGQKAKDTVKAAPQSAKVEKGSIRSSVSCTGRVVSNLDVEIKCKASGEILRLPFDVSKQVTKGQPLVELDPEDEQRTLKKAEIALSASEARLTMARLNLTIAELNLKTEAKKARSEVNSAEARARDARTRADRMKDLREKKLASQEETDTAETSAVQAEAALEQAGVRLEEIKTMETSLDLKRQDVKLAEVQVDSDGIAVQVAQDRLDDTKVFAPISGVITERNVQIGQIISSGISNVGGGTTMMILSDLSQIFVLASVDESDIGKAAVGQRAIVTADSSPGRQFRGEVKRIAARGVTVSNVVTFEVKIEVLSDDRVLLKPEMTANIEIVSEEKKGVLLVPTEALTRRQGKYFAAVRKPDGTTEERTVEAGISDGTRTEIVSGLKEGEEVNVGKTGADSRWNASGRQNRPRGPGLMMR